MSVWLSPPEPTIMTRRSPGKLSIAAASARPNATHRFVEGLGL